MKHQQIIAHLKVNAGVFKNLFSACNSIQKLGPSRHQIDVDIFQSVPQVQRFLGFGVGDDKGDVGIGNQLTGSFFIDFLAQDAAGVADFRQAGLDVEHISER